MTAFVSRVGCMRLFGCVAGGLRACHHPTSPGAAHLPPRPAEGNPKRGPMKEIGTAAEKGSRAPQPGASLRYRFNEPEHPNAAHHPPRGPMEIDNILRGRGRVHALVRPRRAARQRGARHPHSSPRPSQHEELNHALRATRNCSLP